MKKKMGSKLARGVRQVKSQREQNSSDSRATDEMATNQTLKSTLSDVTEQSYAPSDSQDNEKPSPTAADVQPNKQINAPSREPRNTHVQAQSPVQSQAPRAAQQPATSLGKLHPRRIWPD